MHNLSQLGEGAVTRLNQPFQRRLELHIGKQTVRGDEAQLRENEFRMNQRFHLDKNDAHTRVDAVYANAIQTRMLYSAIYRFRRVDAICAIQAHKGRCYMRMLYRKAGAIHMHICECYIEAEDMYYTESLHQSPWLKRSSFQSHGPSLVA